MTIKKQEPVCVRHSFDGYGWKYSDGGNGADWFDRAMAMPDAEPLYEPLVDEFVLRGAVARGWCHEENSMKEFDCDLAEAIVQEVVGLYSPNEGSS